MAGYGQRVESAREAAAQARSRRLDSTLLIQDSGPARENMGVCRDCSCCPVGAIATSLAPTQQWQPSSWLWIARQTAGQWQTFNVGVDKKAVSSVADRHHPGTRATPKPRIGVARPVCATPVRTTSASAVPSASRLVLISGCCPHHLGDHMRITSGLCTTAATAPQA